MRLCFGSYLAVLVLCKAVGVSNKDLCEALLHSVAPKFEFTYKGQENANRVREDVSSKLLRCEQNLPVNDVITLARSKSPEEVTIYFRDKILCLLDENKQKHIILALKDIIANDPPIQTKNKIFGIDNDTKIDIVNGTKKKELAAQSKFCFYTFLAGVFLYTVTNTNNRSGKGAIKSVNDQYIMSFSGRVNEIILVEENEVNRSTPVAIVDEKKADNEIREDVSGIIEKINKLISPAKSEKDLLVTLLAEANGKCLKCGKNLGIPLRGTVPTDKCEIVHLPLSVSESHGYDNAVALCKETCAPLVTIMTNKEKTALLDDKKRLAANLILLEDVSGVRIAREIEIVLREVDKIKNVEGLAEIDITELVDIDKKIYELSLREGINARMKRLFKTVQEICARLEQEISFDTDKFGKTMKFVLESLEPEVKNNLNISTPQEYIIDILVEKLYSQIGQKYKVACEIIVAYLVKRCDLFNETTKQS